MKPNMLFVNSHVDNKDSKLGSELIENGSTTIKRHRDSEVTSLFSGHHQPCLFTLSCFALGDFEF